MERNFILTPMPFVYPSPTKVLLPALRKQGIKVRIRHARRCLVGDPMSGMSYDTLPTNLIDVYDANGSLMDILPHGGLTTVDLLFPDGKSYTGVAKCSEQDRFNRHEGIHIATQRALAVRKHEKNFDGSAWD
jgi:hypothetical protein